MTVDDYDPEPDDLPRAELGEHNEMWAVVCEQARAAGLDVMQAGRNR